MPCDIFSWTLNVDIWHTQQEYIRLFSAIEGIMGGRKWVVRNFISGMAWRNLVRYLKNITSDIKVYWIVAVFIQWSSQMYTYDTILYFHRCHLGNFWRCIWNFQNHSHQQVWLLISSQPCTLSRSCLAQSGLL